jgi:hypothetical protein
VPVPGVNEDAGDQKSGEHEEQVNADPSELRNGKHEFARAREFPMQRRSHTMKKQDQQDG